MWPGCSLEVPDVKGEELARDQILPPTFAPLDNNDPREVGSFRLLGRLGAGGMGTAYLAEGDGEWVVVKVLREELAANPDFRTRLSRELDSLRRVSGSDSIAIVADDLDGASPWFAMEYVEGQTLVDRVRTVGPLHGQTLTSFAHDLGQRIQAIHQAGITHRDIKPSNIVLSPTGPRIIDFGVARVDERTAMTTTGVMVGTLGWAAPEQVAGDPVDQEADVHAWGLCVLYAATGKEPFAAESVASLLYKVVHSQPDIPGVLPEGLSAQISAALRKIPALRPKMADINLGNLEPRTQIDSSLSAEPTQIDETTQADPKEAAHGEPRNRGRRRALAATIGIFTIIAVTVSGLALLRLPGEPLFGPSLGTDNPETIGVTNSPGSEVAASIIATTVPTTVTVGERISFIADVVPAEAGRIVSLNIRNADGWQELARGGSDSAGQVVFSIQAPDRPGKYRYAFSVTDPTGGETKFDEMEVSVRRIQTESVEARWPDTPQQWCAAFDLPYRVLPTTGMRPVELQIRQPGREWETVARDKVGSGGEGVLAVPDCQSLGIATPDDLSWRIRVPATPTYSVAISGPAEVAYCPRPQPISFTTDALMEFAPLEIVIRNDDPQCTAYVRIEAVMYCGNEAGYVGPEELILGRRISDPVFAVSPGSVKRVLVGEIFTDSQADCREYFPLYNVIPEIPTLSVTADYFAYDSY